MKMCFTTEERLRENHLVGMAPVIGKSSRYKAQEVLS